jgi:hypothetical protein
MFTCGNEFSRKSTSVCQTAVVIMASGRTVRPQPPKALSTQVEPPMRAKSTITSRMRENEGKFIRQLEEKDQEICGLKKKLKELSDKRSAAIRKQARTASTIKTKQGKNTPRPQVIEMEVLLRTLSSEKLHLERQLQIAAKSIEDLKSAPAYRSTATPAKADNRGVCEEMLKTIKYKASLCERLEQQTHKAEVEAIRAKAENLRLTKTLAETKGHFQAVKENLKKKDSHSAILDKVTHLEQILDDMTNQQKTMDSGYMSRASSSSSRQSNGVTTSNTPSDHEEVGRSKAAAVNSFQKAKSNDIMIEHNGYTLVDSDLCSSELSDIVEVTEEEPDSFDSAMSHLDDGPRLVVALEDHDDQGHRLSFSVGQLIKIYGRESEDGYLFGEIGDQRGLIPSHLVTEVQTVSEACNDTKRRMVDLKTALYDYNPSKQSPNMDPDVELAFLAGDVLHICK